MSGIKAVMATWLEKVSYCQIVIDNYAFNEKCHQIVKVAQIAKAKKRSGHSELQRTG